MENSKMGNNGPPILKASSPPVLNNSENAEMKRINGDHNHFDINLRIICKALQSVY